MLDVGNIGSILLDVRPLNDKCYCLRNNCGHPSNASFDGCCAQNQVTIHDYIEAICVPIIWGLMWYLAGYLQDTIIINFLHLALRG